MAARCGVLQVGGITVAIDGSKVLSNASKHAAVSYAHAGKKKSDPPPPDAGATYAQQHAHRIRTRAGRQRYKLRQQTVEPVFGIIKQALGFRRFSLRGLVKANLEWTLSSHWLTTSDASTASGQSWLAPKKAHGPLRAQEYHLPTVKTECQTSTDGPR